MARPKLMRKNHIRNAQEAHDFRQAMREWQEYQDQFQREMLEAQLQQQLEEEELQQQLEAWQRIDDWIQEEDDYQRMLKQEEEEDRQRELENPPDWLIRYKAEMEQANTYHSDIPDWFII